MTPTATGFDNISYLDKIVVMIVIHDSSHGSSLLAIDRSHEDKAVRVSVILCAGVSGDLAGLVSLLTHPDEGRGIWEEIY